jgi:hypothetical protein
VLPRITAAEANPQEAEARLAQIAYDFESGIAATYQWAMGIIEDWQLAAAGAVIEPVEAKQALAWSETIEPDPNVWKNQIDQWIPAFQNDSAAFRPDQYPIA